MARHRHSAHRASHGRRGGKRHPIVVAGAVLVGAGVIALLWEKHANAATSSTTNVQGATLPTGQGPSLPSSGDPYQGETTDPAAGGNDAISVETNDSTNG